MRGRETRTCNFAEKPDPFRDQAAHMASSPLIANRKVFHVSQTRSSRPNVQRLADLGKIVVVTSIGEQLIASITAV